ncbi:hypothetical protein LWI29_004194 [Acer saccharum]|uniref:AAA+ ATPase domain-containing protein n=1 Tax=Acer saccharum TaxID=4024 RepID=A0AA39SZ67_ACESA|nr:hypothetical protein LWI29_004194 [Acer saccharum]
MEIVTACVTAIVEDVVKSTGRQVGYLFRFKSIIEYLKEEAESLRSAQDDMQHRVDRAIKDTDEIEKKVEKWLKDVTDVVADAEDLEKQTREKKTCLNGLCPNLIWRYQMARRAQKKISTMSKLKDDGDKFDNISHRTTLSGINVLTPKDFMLFESITNSFNLIIEALKDDKMNVVGLYGMGGVGKTNLAKAVVNKAKEEKIFNEVVMVAVSQTPNIRGIQGQIADQLNFKLQEESVEWRAERLYMRFKNEKKILIILDDIWEKIDLAIIGIPVDDRHKDCKIFLTTRQKQVCIDMGCQSRIPLDVLNEEEGLILFKRHSGLNDDQSPTMIKLAKEVVKECKGLPLAIVAIGSALKEQPIGEWETATQKLRKSKLMDVDIVDEKLYTCLKLSYDYLKNEKTKSCFLLCSLFPEDHEIDVEQLVRYGLGYDIRVNDDDNEGASYPKSRLLKIRGIETTSLVAFKALYEKVEYLELVGIKGCCQNMVSSIDETGLNELKRLSLRSFDELECIVGPTQQVSLQSLTVVEVESCNKLRYLFTLSLARSLLQLEQLTVKNCGSLEHIVEIKEAEENVGGGGGNDVMFPRLRKLQLERLENFINFYSENSSLNLRTAKEQLWGLRHGLQNLEELTICQCRIQVLFHLEGLEQELAFSSLKVLKLYNLKKLECLCKGPMHLLSLPKLKELSVYGCNRLRHMFSPSLARNFMQLEELIIEDCGELEQIFIEDDAAEYHPTLLKDHLQWPLLFPNLSSISIKGCDKLKTLFPAVTTARSGLQKLKTLIVEKSSQLEELFGHKGEADMTSEDREMVLPQLKELALQQLASLVNFCPVGYHFIFPSLSELVVTECPKLTIIFSVDQNRSVHAEAEAPQTGKEDADMEQSPPKTTREIICWDFDDLQSQLPGYISENDKE